MKAFGQGVRSIERGVEGGEGMTKTETPSRILLPSDEEASCGVRDLILLEENQSLVVVTEEGICGEGSRGSVLGG